MSNLVIGKEWVKKDDKDAVATITGLISNNKLSFDYENTRTGDSKKFNTYIRSFVERYEPKPAVDDTFNDDTPAQTFDTGTTYVTRVPNPWRRDEEEVGAAGKTIPFASCDFGRDDKTVTCDFFSLSDDDSGYEIPIGSVWQYMAGSTLEVVTDRGSDWVATRYLRDHFVRNSTQTLKQFRECYRLIYTPGEVCDQ